MLETKNNTDTRLHKLRQTLWRLLLSKGPQQPHYCASLQSLEVTCNVGLSRLDQLLVTTNTNKCESSTKRIVGMGIPSQLRRGFLLRLREAESIRS